jgi:hypothetical protein
MLYIPHQTLLRWPNQEDWDGKNMYHAWGRREVRTWFWWGNLREADHLEVTGLDGKIILKWIFEKWGGGKDWIYLAQARDKGWTLLNAVMNFLVPKNARNFPTSWRPVTLSGRPLLHVCFHLRSFDLLPLQFHLLNISSHAAGAY